MTVSRLLGNRRRDSAELRKLEQQVAEKKQLADKLRESDERGVDRPLIEQLEIEQLETELRTVYKSRVHLHEKVEKALDGSEQPVPKIPGRAIFNAWESGIALPSSTYIPWLEVALGTLGYGPHTIRWAYGCTGEARALGNYDKATGAPESGEAESRWALMWRLEQLVLRALRDASEPRPTTMDYLSVRDATTQQQRTARELLRIHWVKNRTVLSRRYEGQMNDGFRRWVVSRADERYAKELTNIFECSQKIGAVVLMMWVFATTRLPRPRQPTKTLLSSSEELASLRKQLAAAYEENRKLEEQLAAERSRLMPDEDEAEAELES